MGRLGLEPGVIRLVDYDDAWPEMFAIERERIDTELARRGRRICLEHIGSTAVPGLAAKPVLDMLGAPAGAEAAESLIPDIEAAGYEYRPLVSTAERIFFRRGAPRQFHLHLTFRESHVWRDQLTFRDRLRANAVLAGEYLALKRELAARHPDDRDSYIRGKTEFVLRAIAAHTGDRVEAI